jgi:anti-sigma factor RsiW
MSEISEQLERLINRSLDGDLDEDEQLELDRELIRNPQARQMLADYQSVDRIATVALDLAFGKEPTSELQPTTHAGVVAHPRRRHAVRWLIPGAIAAALLATVIPNPWQRAMKSPSERIVSAPMPSSSPMAGADRASVPARTVSMNSGAPARHRDMGRDIIGVLGDDGNLYWIEVEKTRTVTLPHGPAATSRSLNEF